MNLIILLLPAVRPHGVISVSQTTTHLPIATFSHLCSPTDTRTLTVTYVNHMGRYSTFSSSRFLRCSRCSCSTRCFSASASSSFPSSSSLPPQQQQQQLSHTQFTFFLMRAGKASKPIKIVNSEQQPAIFTSGHQTKCQSTTREMMMNYLLLWGLQPPWYGKMSISFQGQ